MEGEMLERDPSLESVHSSMEDVATSSASENGHNETNENAPNSAIGKPPVKFDFHFPEEVWEIILNKLTEDEDRTNCCRAFPIFDQILTRSKTVWMFKQILPFLGRSILDKKSLLTCRRICKQWCADVEHSIVTHPTLLFYDVKDWYLFDYLETIDSFKLEFDGHSGNPFVSRTIGIKNYLEFEASAVEFQRKLLDLLSKFGEHIWTLQFHWNNPSMDTYLEGGGELVSTDYRFFQRVLTNTPNLRRLEFYGDTVIDNEFFEELQRDYFGVLNYHKERYPLPPIPALETLEIFDLTTDSIVASSLISMLVLPYVTQLQNIRLGRSINIFAQMIPRTFPILTDLKLEDVSNDEELQRLLRLMAPLKTLKVKGQSPYKFSGFEDDFSISLSTFLRIFTHFPSLGEVRIDNCFVETPVDLTDCLNFTVRNLTLSYFYDDSRLPTSFNFLQGFKVLEELQVDLWSPRETYLGRTEGKGELQFYQMLEEGQMYESNIWSLIPSLKVVRISWDWARNKGRVVDIGSRKGWEKYKAKANCLGINRLNLLTLEDDRL